MDVNNKIITRARQSSYLEKSLKVLRFSTFQLLLSKRTPYDGMSFKMVFSPGRSIFFYYNRPSS